MGILCPSYREVIPHWDYDQTFSSNSESYLDILAKTISSSHSLPCSSTPQGTLLPVTHGLPQVRELITTEAGTELTEMDFQKGPCILIA